MIYQLFFGLPVAAVIFFGISLSLYLSDRRKNKQTPGSVAPATLHKHRLMLTVSSIIAGSFAAVVIAFAVLLFTAVAFM